MSTPVEEEGDYTELPFGIDCAYIETNNQNEMQGYLYHGGCFTIGHRIVVNSMFPGISKVYIYYSGGFVSCRDIETINGRQQFGRNDKYDLLVLKEWIEENIIRRFLCKKQYSAN